MPLLCLLLMASSPFAAATQSAYAQQDAARLRTLFNRADSQADSLLVRYRLYPLTEEAEVLDGIPTSLSDGTAREYALLSGLWAYRAGEGSFISAIRCGRRSTRLLETAKSLDPDAPFVLLVEGQSLLFRPAIAGRDPSTAADRFSTLAEIVAEDSASGISRTEAQVWQWLALREAERTKKAESLRQRLRSRDLPPLYRQFLKDPPDV
ncbi:MAG: hypothetical protein ABEL51_06060 [Salinibacter sp.]